MSKNIYPDFPKDKFKVKVRHHYEEDGSNHTPDYFGEVHKSKYWTEIVVLPLEAGIPIIHEIALCSKRDTPIRKRGFAIAYNRAVKAAKAYGLI